MSASPAWEEGGGGGGGAESAVPPQQAEMAEDGAGDGPEDVDSFAQRFLAADAIMEDGVLDDIRHFVAAGGQPATIVKNLSASYRGYAEMANQLCNWLVLTGMDRAAVDAAVEAYFSTTVLSVFDPRRADSIFEAEPPSWLDAMIDIPIWRATLFQLADRHNNCLFLNYAMQRMAEAGLQGEITSTTTAASFFDVFNAMLTRTLESAASGSHRDLSAALDGLKEICLQDAHTYLYTQVVLKRLGERDDGALFLRFSQELEAAARNGPNPNIVAKLSAYLTEMAAYPDVAHNLTSMLYATPPALLPGDVISLYRQYSAATPPPIRFLQDPTFFDLFVTALYSTPSQIKQHKSKYLWLLAYAASVRESADAHDGLAGEDDLRTTVDGTPLDLRDLQPTLKAIKTTHKICTKGVYGADLVKHYGAMREAVAWPVVAMGVLHWIGETLRDSEFYMSSTLERSVQYQLLQVIIDAHPEILPRATALLGSLLDVDVSSEPTTLFAHYRTVMTALVRVCLRGYTIPVIHLVIELSKTSDLTLVRFFLSMLLESVEAPYSSHFASAVLDLVGAVGSSLAADAETREYVTSFLSEVGVRVPGEDSADSSDDGGVGGAENLAGVTSRVAQRARAMEEMFFGDADEAL